MSPEALPLQVYEASLAVLLLGYCEDARVHSGNPSMSPKALVEALQVSQRQSGSAPKTSKKRMSVLLLVY